MQNEDTERFRVPIMVELDVEAVDLLDAEVLAAALVKKALLRSTQRGAEAQVVLSEQLNGRRFEAALAGRIKSVPAAARNGELMVASTAQVARWKDQEEGRRR